MVETHARFSTTRHDEEPQASTIQTNSYSISIGGNATKNAYVMGNRNHMPSDAKELTGIRKLLGKLLRRNGKQTE